MAKKPDTDADLVASVRQDAYAAYQAGQRLFQVALPLASRGLKWTGGHTERVEHDHGGVLSALESDGWQLVDAGYVFEPTATSTTGPWKDKAAGTVIGVYMLRYGTSTN